MKIYFPAALLLFINVVCQFSVASAYDDSTRIDNHSDYLTYSYRLYERRASSADSFFTVINSHPVRIVIPAQSEKKYRITDDGSYEFCYLDAAKHFSWEFRPMAQRSFYLETKRQGIIPPDLPYHDFLAMSNAEKQAVIEEGEKKRASELDNSNAKLFDASLNYVATPEGMKIIVFRGTWKAELKPDNESNAGDVMLVKLLTNKINVPRVIENLLNPAEREKISSLDEWDELLEIMRQAGEVPRNIP